MPMGLTPGYLSEDTNLYAFYGPVSSGFRYRVANFLAILAIVLKFQLIIARSVLKCVSVYLNQDQMVHEIRAFSMLPS